MKAPAAIMSPPKLKFPAKYKGAATRIGATSVNQPYPAVIHVRFASPDTKLRMAANTDRGHFDLDAPRFVRFAGGEGDRVDMLIDANQGEPQVGLARISCGVPLDEAASHPIAEQRGRTGIHDGRPHHVARNRELPARDLKNEIIRQRPEHADERREQNRRLQQSDAEIGRELGEVACILMHALVGIDSDGARAGQPEGAAGKHPVGDQIMSQTFAQLELERFAQPLLAHIEREERSSDDGENPELREKLSHVPPRQGIVERLVPAVEADLAVRRGDDDEAQRCPQQQQRVANRGGPQRAGHHPQLRPKALLGDLLGIEQRPGFAVRSFLYHWDVLWEKPILPLSRTRSLSDLHFPCYAAGKNHAFCQRKRS